MICLSKVTEGVLSGFWTACRPQASRTPRVERWRALVLERLASNLRRFSPEEDAKIIEMRRNRVEFREIGLVLGRPPSSVSSRYTQHLVHEHPELPRPVRRGPDKSIIDQKIAQAVKDGKTFRQTGPEVGLSGEQVRKRYYAICDSRDRSTYSPNRSRPFSDGEKQYIERGITKGLSCTKIALELNRRVSSVRGFAHRTNLLPIRTHKPQEYRKGPYTCMDIQRLGAMKQAGDCWDKIGAALSRSPTSVAHRWERCRAEKSSGNEATTTRQFWSSNQRAELIRLFDEGLNRGELALHFNRNRPAVQEFLREELRRIGRHVVMRIPWSVEEDEKLDLYKSQGMTIPEITALMPGRSKGAVRHRLSSRAKQTREDAQAVSSPAR